MSGRYPEGQTVAGEFGTSVRIPLQKKITIGRHVGRQVDDIAVRHVHLLVADNQPVTGQSRMQNFTQKRGHPAVPLVDAGSDIAVDKDALTREAAHGGRQCFAEISQDHMFVIGNAARVGGDLPIENENLPVRHDLAQVIVRAAVSKPQFQNDSGMPGDGGGCEFKTISLSHEAPDDAV